MHTRYASTGFIRRSFSRGSCSAGLIKRRCKRDFGELRLSPRTFLSIVALRRASLSYVARRLRNPRVSGKIRRSIRTDEESIKESHAINSRREPGIACHGRSKGETVRRREQRAASGKVISRHLERVAERGCHVARRHERRMSRRLFVAHNR